MQITVIAPQILRSRLAGHFLSTSCGKVQNTKAGKAKGKSLQNLVVDLIRDYFPCLKDDDIRSALSSECGIDIKLSQYARRLFPYAVECKFRDRIDIWQGLAQAEINATYSCFSTTPLLSSGIPPVLTIVNL